MQRVTQEDRMKSMDSTDFITFVEAVSNSIILNPTAVKFFHRLYDDKLLNIPQHTGRLVRESKEHTFKYRCMMSELKHHAMRSVAVETCTLLGLNVPDYISAKIPNDVVIMGLPKSKPNVKLQPEFDPSEMKHDPSMDLDLFDGHPTRRSHALKQQQQYMLAYGAGAGTLSSSLGISREDAERMKSEFDAQYMCKPLLNTDMSSLEARVRASNLCQEIHLDTQPKTCSLFNRDFSELEKKIIAGKPFDFFAVRPTGYKTKEKPMNLSVTRPVLVGTTDILTAQPTQLDAIIREAKDQIAAGSDLQELSQHHRNIKAELEEVITLCVEQLDKGLEKEESLVS